MPTKKVKKNSNGHLSTRKDIADSCNGKKNSKTEKEFVEASEKNGKAMQKRKATKNVKLPTQRDIAESFDETKLTKAEREAIQAAENVVKMMNEAEKNGFVW